jgi:hypothetical protein
MTASPESKLTTPAFILSIASVVMTAIISGVSIHIQNLKNDSDKQTSRGELIFKNIALLNSQNPGERQLAVAALIWTLGEGEALKVLATVQTVGSDDVKKVADAARDQIFNLNLQRSKNINLWPGKWHFSFAGKSRAWTGDLRFERDRDGTLKGEFSTTDPPLNGKITAVELSDDGTILNGTWSNSNNESGQLYFQLNPGGSSPQFSGRYSMGTVRPAPGSANAWSGTKAPE